MDISAAIIDQHLTGLIAKMRDQWQADYGIGKDENQLRALAFVWYCVKTRLDLTDEQVAECITEGSNDFDVDAIHFLEPIDGEISITIFQAKYKQNLEGNAEFPETAVRSLCSRLPILFGSYNNDFLQQLNERLRLKIAELWSLILDGNIPSVRVVFCNNGKKWNQTAQTVIDQLNEANSQITWEHFNHNNIIQILQATKSIDIRLKLRGLAIVEDIGYSRVCIGRLPVSEVYEMVKQYGDRLLDRNIRRYLGLHGNRVNEGIRETLKGPNPEHFFFLNNGLTLTCSSFTYNAFEKSDFSLTVKDLQVVNGGQTCMTIFRTFEEMDPAHYPLDATVLVRLYSISGEQEDMVNQITYATNSQNPVDLKDLKTNDERQRTLALDIQGLGYNYIRKRGETATKAQDVTPGAAAEALLSVWLQRPNDAKFRTREHFGKFYDSIFSSNLNGAQVITAVLLYRIAENRRKRPTDSDPMFVRYGSCFIAMRMGAILLNKLNLTSHKDISHQNFQACLKLIQSEGETFFNLAVADVQYALQQLYNRDDLNQISLQQLSATFRRGDLLQFLR